MALDAGVVFACGVGAVLGVVHFRSLWTTVRRMADATRPLRTEVVGFLWRVSVSALGLFLLALGGGWNWLAAALIGFLGARLAFVRWARRTSAGTPSAG